MKEIWKPINPQLDIEDCYYVSNLGKIKNIKYNKIQDDIHHSTNGFDYIFIATKDHKPSYQHIDEIVCMTFCQDNVNHVECGKPIIPYHKDGNTRNNRADNLEFVEDIEEWKPLIYGEIDPDRYMISNWGNVFDKVSRLPKVVSYNNSYYPASKFKTINGRCVKYDIHRIVATIFIPGYDDEHNVVNHIDNSYNNHWRNLEWCGFGWNNKHSVYINQCRGHLTIDQVDYIRDLLIEYKDPIVVFKIINKPEIELKDIETIRFDRNSYFKSWKYTQYEIKHFAEMCRKSNKTQYSIDDIIHFCEVIKKCDMSIAEAHNQLVSEGYHVMRKTLYKLKNKESYVEISDKYF